MKLQVRDRKMTNSRLVLANAALLRERCRAKAVIPPPSGDEVGAGIHVRMRSGGWPGRICFLGPTQLASGGLLREDSLR
ncbi:MAG: hypothetical protein DMG79_11365 [Acidobacteria bacterium]|nr:MAG: hypothetical protein DMG79_11365 [Acidobacteriota bacterium]